MFSWNDFINDFPYTNFSDINVSWFLNKFKQIFDEWNGLYTSLQEWKNATDAYNEQWRQQQEEAFARWENDFQNAIDTWKTQTETDINTWEQDTIANLESWKNVFIAEYNALKAQVEQIAFDAENAKNSAEQSAQDAEQSAQNAESTANALQNSFNLINNRLDNVEDTVNALSSVYNYMGTVPTFSDLPATANVGDLYVTEDTGNNYVWNGSQWVNIGNVLSVADGSITENKLNDSLKILAIKDYITPEMYGAVGDGVTDDTSAIQTAIQQAITTGKPFVLLAKTYLITQTLTVDISTQPNVSLEFMGQGFKSLIKNNNTFTGDFLLEFVCSSTNFKGIYIHGFRIESYSSAGGLKINGSIGQSGLIEDIWFMDREQITIKRGIYCTFDRNLGQAAPVCTTLRRVNVRNVMGAGIAIDSSHSVIISECDVALCKMALWLGSASNLTIEKNRLDESDYGIYNNGSTDMGDDNDRNLFPSTSTMHNVTIRNNRFENNKKYAVHLVAYGTNYLAHQGVVIDGNFFDSLDASAGKRGIMLERCTDVSITNNVFKGADASTNGDDDTQNINEYRMNVYNVTMSNNICERHTIDVGGTTTEIKSDTRLGERFGNTQKFVPNIEINQTSCLQAHVNDIFRNMRSVPAAETSGGALDVTTGNYFIINGDTPITALNSAKVGEYKEITLLFNNSKGGTLVFSGTLLLSGRANFVAPRYSSITLVSANFIGGGLKWVEKCRTVIPVP